MMLEFADVAGGARRLDTVRQLLRDQLGVAGGAGKPGCQAGGCQEKGEEQRVRLSQPSSPALLAVRQHAVELGHGLLQRADAGG
jgi:hypothetical protein